VTVTSVAVRCARLRHQEAVAPTVRKHTKNANCRRAMPALVAARKWLQIAILRYRNRPGGAVLSRLGCCADTSWDYSRGFEWLEIALTRKRGRAGPAGVVDNRRLWHVSIRQSTLGPSRVSDLQESILLVPLGKLSACARASPRYRVIGRRVRHLFPRLVARGLTVRAVSLFTRGVVGAEMRSDPAVAICRDRAAAAWTLVSGQHDESSAPHLTTSGARSPSQSTMVSLRGRRVSPFLQTGSSHRRRRPGSATGAALGR